jgi:hypothetical protein
MWLFQKVIFSEEINPYPILAMNPKFQMLHSAYLHEKKYPEEILKGNNGYSLLLSRIVKNLITRILKRKRKISASN